MDCVSLRACVCVVCVCVCVRDAEGGVEWWSSGLRDVGLTIRKADCAPQLPGAVMTGTHAVTKPSYLLWLLFTVATFLCLTRHCLFLYLPVSLSLSLYLCLSVANEMLLEYVGVSVAN